ncbi:hypothetical protein B484DRAFT_467890, partial [Ochromonadaceae sp. CCMP2298]
MKGKIEALVSAPGGINLMRKSERDRMSAFLELGYKFIDSEYMRCESTDNPERAELMKEIFAESFKYLGKYNFHGNKNGVRNQTIPARVLYLAILTARQMGQAAYEHHQKHSPHLPSYAKVSRYIKQCDSSTGFHDDYMIIAKGRAQDPTFPKHATSCMGLVRSCHYNVSRHEVSGFIHDVTMSQLQALLLKELYETRAEELPQSYEQGDKSQQGSSYEAPTSIAAPSEAAPTSNAAPSEAAPSEEGPSQADPSRAGPSEGDPSRAASSWIAPTAADSAGAAHAGGHSCQGASATTPHKTWVHVAPHADAMEGVEYAPWTGGSAADTVHTSEQYLRIVKLNPLSRARVELKLD